MTAAGGSATSARRAGFALAGREPEAVRVAGVAYDKLIMFRRL